MKLFYQPLSVQSLKLLLAIAVAIIMLNAMIYTDKQMSSAISIEHGTIGSIDREDDHRSSSASATQ